MGRIGVDLYAEQLKVALNEVRSFRKSIGGTATNVAVATARLGHHTAVFTRVGDDRGYQAVRVEGRRKDRTLLECVLVLGRHGKG